MDTVAGLIDSLHNKKEKRKELLDSIPMEQKIAIACSTYPFSYETSNFLLLGSIKQELANLGVAKFIEKHQLQPKQVLNFVHRLENYEGLPEKNHAIISLSEIPALLKALLDAYDHSSHNDDAIVSFYQFINGIYSCAMASSSLLLATQQLTLHNTKTEEKIIALNETIQELEKTLAMTRDPIAKKSIFYAIQRTQILVSQMEDRRKSLRFVLNKIKEKQESKTTFQVSEDEQFDPSKHRDQDGYLHVAHVFHTHDTDKHWQWTNEEMRNRFGLPFQTTKEDGGTLVIYMDQKNKAKYYLFKATEKNSGADFSSRWIKTHNSHGGVIIARCHAGSLDETLPSSVFAGASGNFVAILNNCYSSSDRFQYEIKTDRKHIKIITNNKTGYGGAAIEMGFIFGGLKKPIEINSIPKKYKKQIDRQAKHIAAEDLNTGDSNIAHAAYLQLYRAQRPLLSFITDENLRELIPSYQMRN